MGFEPTVQLPVLRFSRPALSSTQPSLREWNQGRVYSGIQAELSVLCKSADCGITEEIGCLARQNPLVQFNEIRMWRQGPCPAGRQAHSKFSLRQQRHSREGGNLFSLAVSKLAAVPAPWIPVSRALLPVPELIWSEYGRPGPTGQSLLESQASVIPAFAGVEGWKFFVLADISGHSGAMLGIRHRAWQEGIVTELS